MLVGIALVTNTPLQGSTKLSREKNFDFLFAFAGLSGKFGKSL
jgi:hypothetical protein